MFYFTEVKSKSDSSNNVENKTVVAETQENKIPRDSRKGRKMKYKKKTSLDEDGYMGVYNNDLCYPSYFRRDQTIYLFTI